MSSVSLHEIRQADKAAHEVSARFLPSIEWLGSMNTDINMIRRLQFGHAIATSPETRAAFEQEISVCVADFESDIVRYRALGLNEKETQLLQEVQTAWATATAASVATLKTSREQGQEAGLTSIRASRAVTEQLGRAVESLLKLNLEEAEEAAHQQDEATANAYWITGVASALVLVISIVIALRVAKSVVAPVVDVASVLTSLAEGDLTKQTSVTSRDEVGRMASTLNSSMSSLRSMIGGISQHSQGIAGAAEELSAVSKQLTTSSNNTADQARQAAASATEVSSSIATCAAGIEEMGASVSEIAKNAGEAATVAEEGVAAAAHANSAMTRLGASSNEIGDIVKVITSIAEQTNLLALNATIEAARAGDAGRGFAVVASEVKELARKTTDATSDIGKRVAGIQGDSQAAQDALKRIGDIITKINALQQSIASAVEEQSATTKELGSTLSQVSQTSSDIAKSVETVSSSTHDVQTSSAETLKASTELAKLAAELKQQVVRFRT